MAAWANVNGTSGGWSRFGTESTGDAADALYTDVTAPIVTPVSGIGLWSATGASATPVVVPSSGSGRHAIRMTAAGGGGGGTRLLDFASSFETTDDGWVGFVGLPSGTAAPTVARVTSPTDASSAGALQMTPASGTTLWIVHTGSNITFATGSLDGVALTVTAKVRAATVAGTIDVRGQFYAPGVGGVGGEVLFATGTDSTSGFVTITGSVTVPAGAGSLELRIYGFDATVRYLDSVQAQSPVVGGSGGPLVAIVDAASASTAAGAAITASAWVKLVGVTARVATPSLRYLDATGTVLATATGSPVTLSGTAQKVSVTGSAAPTGTSRAQLQVSVASPGTGEQFDFDLAWHGTGSSPTRASSEGRLLPGNRFDLQTQDGYGPPISPGGGGGGGGGTGGTGSGSLTWSPVVGGGGLCTNLDEVPGGALYITADTYGAYKWNTTTSRWDQVFTPASIGSVLVGAKGDATGNTQDGAYAIAQAPSAPATVYAVWANRVWRSTDSAATWTVRSLGTTFAAGTTTLGNDEPGKFSGQKLAVDPRDPTHVLLIVPAAADGTTGAYVPGTGGLYRSTDSAATWTKVVANPAIPAGAPHSDAMGGLAFDPRSVATSGKTSGVFVVLNGTSGGALHKSTNAAVSFATTSGPTLAASGAFFAGRAQIGPNPADSGATSIYYMATVATNQAFKYVVSSSTFTQIGGTSRGWMIPVAHPAVAGLIVLFDQGGSCQKSTDAGATFSTLMPWYSATQGNLVGGQVPWVGNTDTSFLLPVDVRFPNDGTSSTKLRVAYGLGYAEGDAATIPGDLTLVDKSQGIEQLVIDDIQPVGTTSTSRMVVTFWDQGIALVDVAASTYQSQLHPIDGGQTQHQFNDVRAFAVHPTNPAIGAHNRSGHQFTTGNNGQVQGGYTESLTTAVPTWTRFPAQPRGATLASSYGFGSIAVVPLASGSYSVVWAGASSDGSTGSGVARQPHYSLNKGVTWVPVNIPLTEWSGAGGFLPAFCRHIVCADPVTVGRVYLHIASTSGQTSGLWRSDDGGVTWSLVHGDVVTFVFNGTMKAVPGRAGHLFMTAGGSGGTPTNPFVRSIDAGVTWTTVAGLIEVWSFGFGEPATVGGYPTIFAFGYSNPGLVWGLYASTDNAATWTLLSAAVPGAQFDWPTAVSGAFGVANRGKVWVGFRGAGAYRGVP